MSLHQRLVLARWTAPPFLLTVLLLLLGLAMATQALWVGRPLRMPLLGTPGVFRTFDPQLRALEDAIAHRRAGPVTIRMTQQQIDAELAAQLDRLAGRLPLRDPWLRPGAGVLTGGGQLLLGLAVVPATIELTISAQDCRPIVAIRSLSFGSGDTPAWLQARADALVRRAIDDTLARGLGFCLTDVVVRPGEIHLDGRVEGEL